MISIIIPVYNERGIIDETLKSLPFGEDIEVIVVDGESIDGTLGIAEQHPVKAIQCAKNRALQMNSGAEASRGDILLFLHADCWFEEGSLEAIQSALRNGYDGGCLSQRINSKKTIFRWIEASGNIRAKIFKVFYGDQAIFVRRDIFFKLGRFDEVSLFEDILFSRKMKRECKIRVFDNKVFVSPRRWEKKGIIKTTLINWILSLGFLLNMPFDSLKRIYRDIR